MGFPTRPDDRTRCPGRPPDGGLLPAHLLCIAPVVMQPCKQVPTLTVSALPQRPEPILSHFLLP